VNLSEKMVGSWWDSEIWRESLPKIMIV